MNQKPPTTASQIMIPKQMSFCIVISFSDSSSGSAG